MKIYVADLLDQFDGEPSFKYIAEAFDIKNEQQQIKLQGIGNIIKLIIFEPKKKNQKISFNKIGFEIFKIWGWDSPVGISRINNKYLLPQNNENDMNQILIEQGILNEYDQLNNKFWNENNQKQIDQDTRISLNALLKKKQELIQKDDFQTVRLLNKDLKQVLKIGQQIYDYECELKIQLCKENYSRLYELKQQIEELNVKRDYYDMLYETEVYEQMIIMDDDDNFNTSQYIKQYTQQNEIIQKSIPQENVIYKENTPIKKTPIKIKTKQVSPQQSIKKPKKKVTQIKKKVLVKDDDLWTKGDRDLEKYFKFDSKQQEQVFLKQLQGMKIENKDVEDIFGRKIWGCLNSDSWKLRKKAAEAIYNYIKTDKNGNPSKNIQKYKNKEDLFKGLCQTLLIILNDKIHQIFMVGVDIMDECFSKNICDNKINKQIFTNYLSQIVYLLIERSQVINKKIQVQTINSLLSLFGNNHFNMKILVKQIKKFIKEKDSNGDYIKKDFEKIPKYKIFALLQIFYNSFSIDPENKCFLELFQDILIPCLYHSDIEIKDQTLNLFEQFYPYHPEEALNFIENCDDINKFVYEKLDLIIENINQNILKQKSEHSIIQEIPEEESQEKSQLDNTQDEIINT